jgi:predicted nuclease of restriction endonuclease-like (RecB) superfamily
MNGEYKQWLAEIKEKIRTTQIKAALRVNAELLHFYWRLGADILAAQTQSSWGDALIPRLSKDLLAEFPEMSGFSERNLKYIRQWYLYYAQHIEKSSEEFGQQLVAQICQIPWGHNIAIVTKCKELSEATFYIQRTREFNWSRSVLTHQIESRLWEREGKAVTNFVSTLPEPQSDLANQTLKDPYIFDFLTLTKECNERDLEKGLIQHITHFLLELGAGFAYIGRQVPIQVGERSFFIDLLFYHVRLHCYVVVELKATDFEPEHTGQLNFYIKAVDEQLRKGGDEPTIGILLCKSKDRLVAEYALSDINKPIGVSEYHLTQSLPEELKSSLPTIAEIEAELSEDS